MAKKIVVPTLDVVETVSQTDLQMSGFVDVNLDSTTQEDTTMETKVDAAETVTADSITLDVTLAELIAYTPDAIKGAIDEIKANHNTVNVLIGKLPDAVIQQTRDALGITDSLDADVDAIKARLGGKVATIIDEIKRDNKWDVVVEYREMLRLINAVNDARAKLGLAMLTVKVGARTKGAAISQEGSISNRNTTGFMRPGIYAWNGVGNTKIDWIVTNDNILVNVDGIKVYSGKQGDISLSKIHNDYVLPACDGSGRESFPAFLVKQGYHDATMIMLHAKPEFPVES